MELELTIDLSGCGLNERDDQMDAMSFVEGELCMFGDAELVDRTINLFVVEVSDQDAGHRVAAQVIETYPGARITWTDDCTDVIVEEE